jgi:hypothetical protein
LKIMRIGCDVYHGIGAMTDARGAGLRGRVLVRSGLRWGAEVVAAVAGDRGFW